MWVVTDYAYDCSVGFTSVSTLTAQMYTIYKWSEKYRTPRTINQMYWQTHIPIIIKQTSISTEKIQKRYKNYFQLLHDKI